MNQQDKVVIVHGLALIGRYGREAREAIQEALVAGELGIMEFDEAQEQVAKIDGAQVVAEAFVKRAEG